MGRGRRRRTLDPAERAHLEGRAREGRIKATTAATIARPGTRSTDFTFTAFEEAHRVTKRGPWPGPATIGLFVGTAAAEVFVAIVASNMFSLVNSASTLVSLAV